MKLNLLVVSALILLASPLMGDVTHTVQTGETLYSIARKYGVPLATLMKDNSIEDATKVRVGTRLLVKGVDTPEPAIATVDYVVEKDDTFWSISRRYHLSLDQLKALNPGVDPARLGVGVHLKVPAGETPAEAAPAATPRGTAVATDATGAATGARTATTAVTPPPLTALPRAAGTEAELWPHPGPRTAVKDRNFQHTSIAAKVGDPVVAVASGQVVWVSPFSTYVNIVIIETRAARSRDAYQFWYAGVDDVYVRTGEWVNKGATIARVATNGIDAKARVAFGVYQGTTPVDHTRMIWQ